MLALPDVQQIAADNASKAQKRQARYYNASRREVRYNLGDKVETKSRAFVRLTGRSRNISSEIRWPIYHRYPVRAKRV